MVLRCQWIIKDPRGRTMDMDTTVVVEQNIERILLPVSDNASNRITQAR